MKYLLFFIGAISGNLIASTITQLKIIQLGVGGFFGLIGYNIPSFLIYTKSSPIQLLKFHGPNSPITKSRSTNEIRTIIMQLNESGLIKKFYPFKNQVIVENSQWKTLGEDSKNTLCQIIFQACLLENNSVIEIYIYSNTMNQIAIYSPTSGFSNTN